MNAATPVHQAPGGHGLTSFIGRRRELGEARDLMSRSRLLTLVGPGGVGKTRLAIEVSSRSRKAFRDGVWLVELAALEDGSEVGSQIGAALGLLDQSNRSSVARLADYLEQRQLLIVLDNCEHVLGAVSALAARLLDSSPGLRIVATSREPLSILGEQVYRVPPLAAPDETAASGPVESFESVQLLVDRARSVDPDFEITPGNRLAVAQLCQRLDGIPLAIELAASRLRSLSVVQLVERLDRRFDILTGGSRVAMARQQTLRALIDWSYELCSGTERLLWTRLAVFPGGFDLESAEDVCGFGELERAAVIDQLDQLIAKSLVVAERVGNVDVPDGERLRYRQLMTFREYGAELLEASGESSELRRRQRDHYLARAAAMVDLWCGPDQAERLAAARRDHANLLSALDWSASTAGEELAGTRLAALLRYHWIAGGNLSDGRRWLDRMLTLSTEASPERAEALWSAAWVCLIQGDRDVAQRYLAECRRIATQLEDRVLAADADHWTALYELFSGHVDEAIALFRTAIEVHLEVGKKASAFTAMFQLAMAQTYTDTPEDALATCREVLRQSEDYGERWNHAYAHWAAGLCQWHLGRLEEARQSQISALEILRDFLDGICAAVTIEQLSWMAASNDHYESAAVLFHAAQGVWKGLGTTMSAFGPHIQADSEQVAARVRRELGPNRFEAILANRTVPSRAEAIEFALAAARTAHVGPGVTRRPVPRGSREAGHTGASATSPLTFLPPTGLTKREVEVAALVAEGCSNKEIAAKLVISQRTVDGHVEHILSKLGFTSRTQIAVWFAERVGPSQSTAR